MTTTCIAQSPVTVEVVNGEVHSARGGAGCILDPADPDREPLTALEWFDYLAAADLGPDAGLEIEFNDSGFPLRVFFLPAGGFVEASVAGFTEGPLDRSEEDVRKDALASAREMWAQSGPTSYRFELRLDCFCDPANLGPFQVTVRAGVVVEMTREGVSVLGQSPAQNWSDYLTIEDIFERIDDALTADGLEVVYDPQWGFPVSFFSDPDRRTYDDELGVQVEGLEPG